MASTLDLEQARAFVDEKKEITDVSGLQEDLIERADLAELSSDLGIDDGTIIAKLRSSNQVENMYKFQSFFATILSNPPAVIQEYNYTIAKAEDLDLPARDLRQETDLADPRFNDPDNALDLLLEEVLSDTDLRKTWLREVDNGVKESTEDNLAQIDQAAAKGQRIKKNIVIVGGGPGTAVAVSILSPLFQITVITEQESIGEPWRSRPFYINSSTEEEQFGAARLPLLEGSTTPITGSGQLNYISPGKLLDATGLSITCTEGRRKYIGGRRLGAAIATNIALGADDYLAGQRVDIPRTKVNADGTKTLTIRDNKGTSRELDAEVVLFFTGPGKEEFKINDPESRDLAYDARLELNFGIQTVKQLAHEYREQIAALSRQNTPEALQKAEGFRRRIKELRLPVPRVLNLSMVEQLYRTWINDLEEEPDSFPLLDVLNEKNTVAFAGSGDSTLVLAELTTGNGPPDSYPRELEFRKGKRPSIVLYNQKATTFEEFQEQTRPRYRGIWTAGTDKKVTPKKNKVASFREVQDKNGNIKIEVADTTGAVNIVDYLFLSTGVTRTPIEKLLPAKLRKITDNEGEVVALGDFINDIYAVGPATGFRAPDFPQPIRDIIEALGIKENTISRWVNAILEERFLLTLASELPLDEDKIRKLIQNFPRQT